MSNTHAHSQSASAKPEVDLAKQIVSEMQESQPEEGYYNDTEDAEDRQNSPTSRQAREEASAAPEET